MEELFFPLIKTSNTNNEAMQAPQNQTLAALEVNTNGLKAFDPKQQSRYLDDRDVT